MANEPKPKTVPMGPALTVKEMIEQIGDGSDGKVESAKANWRKNAPKKFEKLLDATEEEAP